MRQFLPLTVIAILAVGQSVCADDLPKPKGAIGVKMEVTDGKIFVRGTLDNSPAAKAGLKEDDVVVKVDGMEVKQKDATREDLQELIKHVTKHEPGDKIKFTVKRGDKEMTVEITVGKPGDILPKKDD